MAKYNLSNNTSLVWNSVEQKWVPCPKRDGTDALGNFNKSEKDVKFVDEDKYVTYKNPETVSMNQGYQKHTSGAMREKIQSIRYDYMPARIVNESYARVADFGANKYDVDNWMKGLPQSQLAASLQRHLWAYMDGEDNDEESNLCHLDHVLWNAVALVYNRYHDLEDDRFESRKASK